MSWDSKVLWTEGLFLQPHHFQQADRYTEALVAGLAPAHPPYAWGFQQVEIDEEALKVGQFALKSCSGLTAGRGTVFRVPADRRPSARAGRARGDQGLRRLSGVPQRRQGATEVDMTGAELSAARLRPRNWRSPTPMGTDKQGGDDGVGKLRLQFALAVDDLADRLVIPIARIVEVQPDKEVILDKAFIPTCIDARAAVPADWLPARTGGASGASDEGAGRAAVGSPAPPGRGGDLGFPAPDDVNRMLPVIGTFWR
jgi:type VI secretion system protein ImpJ